jgi:putative transposase
MNVFALWPVAGRGENGGFCREFAISRKTGYKICDRYKESGLDALTDRSRRPWRYCNQLPLQVETAIVNLKQEKPHLGCPRHPRTLAATLFL